MEAEEEEIDAGDADMTDQNDPLPDMNSDAPQTAEEMNAEIEMKLSDNVQKEMVATMNALSHVVAKVCKEKQATKDTVEVVEANLDSLKNLINTAKNEVKKSQ